MISWIKLDINILDDAKIKIIRSHPNGDSVVLLWIGLLCLAMKSSRPGTIEIADGLPYTLDDLANQFNIEKKTVEMGLALFLKYRMVDVFEGGSIDVINFSKHQSLDKIEFVREQNRARQRRHRKSKLLAITSGNCVYCGSKDNLEVDHIIPISHGGKGTDDNLVSACRDCNTSKNNHNILHFLNYILVDKADHNSIRSNQNLMRLIRFDSVTSRYVTRDAVTRNATDLDLDKDLDKELKATEPFRLPSKEELENSSKPLILENIDKAADELYEKKIWPKVHSYKNAMLKKGCNERAVLHSLTRCLMRPPENPWAYCASIMKKEDGNFNARDYEKNHG